MLIQYEPGISRPMIKQWPCIAGCRFPETGRLCARTSIGMLDIVNPGTSTPHSELHTVSEHHSDLFQNI